MSEKTINEEIEILVNNIANNNPAPEKAKITKNYPEKQIVDIETENGEIYKTIPYMGNNTVGKTAILIFLYGEKPFAICI